MILFLGLKYCLIFFHLSIDIASSVTLSYCGSDESHLEEMVPGFPSNAPWQIGTPVQRTSSGTVTPCHAFPSQSPPQKLLHKCWCNLPRGRNRACGSHPQFHSILGHRTEIGVGKKKRIVPYSASITTVLFQHIYIQ